MNPLTRRQTDVLDTLIGGLATRGFYPTPKEIARELGLKTSETVRKHLTALEQKGYINRDPRHRRLTVLRGLAGELVRVAVLLAEDE